MKHWLRGLSLRTRLLLVIGAVTTLTMVTFVLLTLGVTRSAAYEGLAQQQSTLARLVAQHSAVALLYGDADLARESLWALAPVAHIRSACLYGHEDSLFANFHATTPGPSLPCPQRLPSAPPEARGMIFASAPVDLHGRSQGHLLLASSTGPLEQRLGALLWRGVASAVVALMLALGMAALLAHRLSRPIARLAAVARQVVDSGDTTLRAPVAGQAELGHLALAFNRMLNRLQEQADLQRTQADYNEVLFQQSPLPVIVVDGRSGRMVDCNEAAIRIYGFGSRAATLATSAADVSTPLQYDGTPSAEAVVHYAQAALAGEPQVYEWRHRRPDGSEFDAEVRLVRFGPENAPMLLGSLLDVTARKRAEAELRLLNEALENRVAQRTAALAASNAELSTAIERLRHTQDELVRRERLASLGSLVAGVAHELNTPLGSVLLAATTLGDGVDELRAQLSTGELTRSRLDDFLSQQAETSRLVQRNAQRAAELIARFKQVAMDQTTEQRRHFDLGEVVEEVMATLQPRLRRTLHRVVLDVPPGLRMDGYPGPLGQVLTNLVINALLHGLGERAGTIEVRARGLGDEVEVEVSDDGAGIPPEHLPKLFDPFFTTKLGEGGSGLGLHIVYGLVERTLGGRISVHSAPGQGARFCVRLPKRAPVPAQDQASTAEPDASAPQQAPPPR